MVLATVSEVVGATLQAYTNGVHVAIRNKSLWTDSDYDLRDRFDVRTHCLRFTVTGTPDDFQELVTKIEENAHDVRAVVETIGFERNTRWVMFSNLKSFARSMSIDEATIREVAGGLRVLPSNEERYMAVGSAIRTRNEARAPGILLGRS